MAFELPFVAFDVAETRILAQGAAAYARRGDPRDFGRLIGELLDDPRRRSEMGRIGRRRIEEAIAWERQQRTYVDVYRRLLRGPGGPQDAAATT